MNWTKTFLAAAVLALSIGTPPVSDVAQAGGSKMTAPWGPGWMFRIRGIGVLPDADGSNERLVNPNVPLTADVDIGDSLVPELDITYFFTPHIAAELILGITPHDVEGEGALLGDLGEAWLLPPILTLQYHFNPGGKVKPYVGAGINYTIFFSEDGADNTLPNAGLTAVGLDLDDSFGWALQVGADIHLMDNIYLNFDVKKLYLDTEAKVTTSQGGAAANIVLADVDIDPWLIGVGVGIKLGAPEPAPIPMK